MSTRENIRLIARAPLFLNYVAFRHCPLSGVKKYLLCYLLSTA